jgi:galactoside O-acetyltransferase
LSKPEPKIYPYTVITPETQLDVGWDTFIGNFCLIHAKRLTMGDGSQINAGTKIVGGGEVVIGEYTVISYNCVLLTATDTPSGEYLCDAKPESKRKIRRGKIVIGNNVMVGAGSVVMPNVTIGEGAVIGAGSYIDFDVEPYTIIIPKHHIIIKPRPKVRC